MKQRAKKRELFAQEYVRKEIDRMPVTGETTPVMGRRLPFRRRDLAYECLCGQKGHMGSFSNFVVYSCGRCGRLYKAEIADITLVGAYTEVGRLVELATFNIQNWMLRDEYKIRVVRI
jgi:hypothetical protein